MPDERRPDDDPLVRYWDEVVRGGLAPQAHLDPVAVDMVNQVHALDDTPAPDQFFVTNLWEDLMDTVTRTAPLVPKIHPTSNGTATSRPHATEWPGTRAAHSQHRWGALATAALLVLILGGTFIAFGRPSPDRNDGFAGLATPVAPQPLPEMAIDPTECQVEPRSDDEILALWYPASGTGTPVQTDPLPETRTSIPVPLGEQADPRTVEAVSATLREAVACINAGDVPRFFALLSDDFVGSLGGETNRSVGGRSFEDDRGLLEATPAPLPFDKRIKLIAVTNVSMMADGRVGALFVHDDPNRLPPVQTLLTIFVEEHGRWVFDEFVDFTGGQ